jgi:hypothetical protein
MDEVYYTKFQDSKSVKNRIKDMMNLKVCFSLQSKKNMPKMIHNWRRLKRLDKFLSDQRNASRKYLGTELHYVFTN